MQIGIFGGSFDPIHNAHLIVAQLAREQLGLDVVRFVVAGEQPHKPGGHHAAAADRAEMVARAVDGLEGLEPDLHEAARPGPSYTVDTLRHFRNAMPGARFVLLLGADAAGKFETWREPAEIRRLCQVAVFQRAGMAAPGGFDLAVTIPAIEISSTAIRARSRAGHALGGWVPDAVGDYISGLRLYRSDRG
ncbi:MAG: nicotinate (nicotinamide) nucleotide adenylyltransferase [Gemmatimonadales bacterium]|nr:nicotinate (nicotinamide) nucleotide adenylyltransferase [Gemmatimonadales bacterium]